MNTILKILILWFFSIAANAEVAKKPAFGIGAVAQNLMEPVNFFSDFIDAGCFIIGGGFIFASIIKYVEHRRSPLMTPISTVIFLFVAGIILISLPLVSYVAGYGVPFSLLK